MSGRHTRSTAVRVIAAGAVLATVYVVLAIVSGQLSPLARRPALDGLGPLTPYRWVAPPPEVQDNEAPTPGSFDLRVQQGGTLPDVVFTPDAQVTLILDRGAIRSDDRRVLLEVTPLDAATLGPPPDDLVTFGNAIRIDGTQEPSGEPATAFRDMISILVYPETPTLHALEHELLYSSDGRTWDRLESDESIAQSQVRAEVPAPGYLVVAGVSRLIPTTPRPPGADTGGVGTLPTILLVVSIASLLLGIGLLVRARRPDGSPPRRSSARTEEAG